MTQGKMKIKKEFEIKNVIVTVVNIRQIADLLMMEYNKNCGQDNTCPHLTFNLKSSDGTQYECDYDGTFNSGILENNRISKVQITYRDCKDDRRISITLEDTALKFVSSNEVEVNGNNENWVNGIILTIQERLNNFQQRNFVLGLIYKHSIISDIIILMTILFTIEKPFKPAIDKLLTSSNTIGTGLVLYFTLMCVAIVINIIIQRLLKYIFPIVELNLGQEHHQGQKKLRKALFFIFIVLVPAIFTVIGTLPLLRDYIAKGK